MVNLDERNPVRLLGNQALLLVLRILLGTIFIVSAVSKLPHQAELIETVNSYGILPHGLAGPFGMVLPWLELFAGISLLSGLLIRVAVPVTIALIAAFTVANFHAVMGGAGGDCGCFGNMLPVDHRQALIADLLMLLMVMPLLLKQFRPSRSGVALLPVNPSAPPVRGRFPALCSPVILAMVSVLVLTFLPVLGATHLLGQRPGTDCGCTKTDAYVAPDRGKEIRTQTVGLQEGQSPGGTYQVTATTTSVTVTKGGAEVLYVGFTGDAAWGFSPDEHRFAINMLKDTSYTTRLFNLEEWEPGPRWEYTDSIWHHQVTASGAQYQVNFSPKGNYLFYATINASDQLTLFLVDAKSGTVQHQDQFSIGQQAGLEDSRYGGATWGYSRDDNDAAFMYAWMTTDLKVQMKMVDLVGGEVVWTDGPLDLASAFWRFSPCGDTLGLVTHRYTTAGDQFRVRLVRTLDGHELYNEQFSAPVQLIQFESTTAWHVVTVHTSDTDYIEINMTENQAAGECPSDPDPEPPPDTEAPTWPSGSTITFEDVEYESLTVKWSEAVDNVGVTAYRVFQDGVLIDTVADNVLSLQVTGLDPDTSYIFGVRAGDEAGNWSSLLGASIATPAVQPPSWPQDTTFEARNACPAGTVTLEMSASEQKNGKWVGVEGATHYRIYCDDDILDTVTATSQFNMSYPVTDLTLDQTYEFKLEAGNEWDVWSEDGPSVTITVRDICPPEWPAGSQITVSNISSRSVTLSWPDAEDDVAVSHYMIFRGHSPLVQVDGGTTSHAVTGLHWGSTYTFRVAARDQAGNWSEMLESAPVTMEERTKEDPPTWPAGSELLASGIGATSLTLDWTEAADDEGVAFYRVFAGDVRIATLLGDTRTYQVTGLNPGRDYLFTVQAGDAWDNWTSDGPSVAVSTADGPLGPFVPGETELIGSYDRFHEKGSPWPSYIDISACGRFVAFVSTVEPLDTSDPWHSPTSQVFVYDRETGTTEMVSVSSSGTPGNGHSDEPAISADGRYIAFVSRATNLDPRDIGSDDWRSPFYWRDPSSPDIFLHDRETGETRMVSVYWRSTHWLAGQSMPSFGNSSRSPSISDDGRFIAFYDPGLAWWDDDAPDCRIFVYDRLSGFTEPIDFTLDGVDMRGSYPVISGDGRYVAFTSKYPGDFGQATSYIYVYDRWSGRILNVSVSSTGELVDSQTGAPLINDDGSLVAFESSAADLVPGDTNEAHDVFVRDLETRQTTRASLSSTGEQLDIWNGLVSMSADGRFVFFTSHDPDVVPGDPDSAVFVYVRDRLNNTTSLVDLTGDIDVWNGSLGYVFSSACGDVVVFEYIEVMEDVEGGDGMSVSIFRYSYFVHQLAQGDPGSGDPSAPTYALDLAADPAGGGTVTDMTGAGPYEEGAVISVKAVAAEGYRFVGWSAPAGVFDNAGAAETTFTMPGQSVTIMANFEAIVTITITPDPGQSKAYGEDDPPFTFTYYPALESGDSFSGELGRQAGENVNIYAYTLGTLSAGPQYRLVLAADPATFEITRAALTVTADDRTKGYGSGLTFDGDEFSAVGLVGDDQVTSAILSSAGAAVDAGPGQYDIEIGAATGVGLQNYVIEYVKGTLTVTGKTLVISSSDGGSVTSPGEGTFVYEVGTSVDLVAQAAEGYRFVEWTGDVGTVADVESASTNITVNGDYNIRATFEAEEKSGGLFGCFGGSVDTGSSPRGLFAGWGIIGLLVLGGPPLLRRMIR